MEIAGESWLIRPSSWPILQSQMLVVSLDRALSHLLPIELSQALALPCEDTHMPTLEHTHGLIQVRTRAPTEPGPTRPPLSGRNPRGGVLEVETALLTSFLSSGPTLHSPGSVSNPGFRNLRNPSGRFVPQARLWSFKSRRASSLQVGGLLGSGARGEPCGARTAPADRVRELEGQTRAVGGLCDDTSQK